MSDAGRREHGFRSIGAITEEAQRAAPGAASVDGAGGGGGGGGGEPAAPPAAPEGGSVQRSTTEQGGDLVSLPSLCMSCRETGLTRLLLTRIPFFRDVILMAFECEHCGLRNSEVQAASVQERGVRFELAVAAPADLNRQLVKGDRAAVRVPELDFEIPPGTQGGVFTTVEGLLRTAADALASSQAARRALDAPGADAVDAFLRRLRAAADGDALPFTLELDDPSGNSFVENPAAPAPDARLRARHYVRSREQNAALGIYAGNAREGEAAEQGGEDGGGGGGGVGGSGGGGVGGGGGGGGEGGGEEGGGARSAADDVAAGGAGGAANAADADADAGAADDAPLRAVGPDAPVEDGAVDAAALVGSSARAVHVHATEDAAGAARAAAAAAAEAAVAAAAQLAVEHAAAAAQLAEEHARHEALKAHLRATAAAAAAAGAAAGAGGGAGGGGRDESGNVPGGFRKGGALIPANTTARAGLTADRVAGGAVFSPDGAIGANVFDSSSSDAAKEVMTFPVPCHVCGVPGECRMTVTDVPHFKEIILMAFDCEGCGWRNVEVKGGGAVPPHGTVTRLRFTPGRPWSADDLRRDVIKGDTAAVELPELALELGAGGLGGLYTTVEGLLTALRDKLAEADPFGAAGAAGGGGDSAARAGGGAPASSSELAGVLSRLDAAREGAIPFTLVIRDPMANTWVYSPYAGSGLADPRLDHEPYTRSAEEDDELGLSDMNAPEG